jgi:hypothetical protein
MRTSRVYLLLNFRKHLRVRDLIPRMLPAGGAGARGRLDLDSADVAGRRRRGAGGSILIPRMLVPPER